MFGVRSEDTHGTEESPEVYQANPLIEARKPMNALEMRLFLLAVAAVNPHLSEKDKYYDHEFKELHLKPGELKAIFGNGSYLTRLEEVCDGLMERTIKLRDGKGGFVIYTVFDVIRYKPKDGLRISSTTICDRSCSISMSHAKDIPGSDSNRFSSYRQRMLSVSWN